MFCVMHEFNDVVVIGHLKIIRTAFLSRHTA